HPVTVYGHGAGHRAVVRSLLQAEGAHPIRRERRGGITCRAADIDDQVGEWTAWPDVRRGGASHPVAECPGRARRTRSAGARTAIGAFAAADFYPDLDGDTPDRRRQPAAQF